MAKKVVRKASSESKRAKPVSRSKASKSRVSPSVKASKGKTASRKVSAKSNSVKRNVSRAQVKNVKTRNSIKLVANNLIVFFLLFLVSIIFTKLFSGGVIPDHSDVFFNLFAVFSIAFGFISFAFLIVLLIFVFLRLLRKR